MIDLDAPNDYTAYQGEVDTAWLRQRIDHAMNNVSDLVMSASQMADLCQAMEERDAMKARMDARWAGEGYKVSLDELGRRAASVPRGPYVAKVTNGGTDIEAKPTDTQIALVEHDDDDTEALAIAHYLEALDPGAVLSLVERWRDAEYLQAERDALRDMADDYRSGLELIAAALGTPKEPHQGFCIHIIERAGELNARAASLNAKLQCVHDELYGKGFEVANYHLNGELERLDNWFEENDWEPIELDKPEIAICPECFIVQLKSKGECSCGAGIPGDDLSEANLYPRERAAALQWVADKGLSHQDLPPMIERLTAIADGKRQPCQLLGMMCRGCPDCMGVVESGL
ncbi:hypothetical protein [Vreelandella alkaliphila]|uniref:Uncharacterized protein n=1 Tax=Vreelandella alkaliphila TaxID=272774 RepID=A0AAJ2S475_9GAMM|nr:hypothetical protein [Halomonas alkaliphila]MDX5979584.1 hypothetical protein [Halomonas alkaliphila]